MAITSYAQNFEDVMLWRAFKDKVDGFYIDVGANHPEIDSVTKSFYEKGWSGINIEPVENEFELLLNQRDRDINLNAAVGSVSGRMPLFTFPGTGLSTLDPNNAGANAAAGHAMHEREIDILTLTDIFKQHVTRTVDFLKIDVEGWERDVLLGADFQAFRPTIILVESTMPGSQKSNHETWESLLLNANYSFIWFDGLNRFYVANERFDEISPLYKVPPNIFDGFVSQSFSEAGRSEENWLRAEWRAALAEKDSIQAERDALSAERNWLQSEWNGALAQIDAARFERDTVTADRDWLRSEWNATLTKMDAIQFERDALIAERDWLRTEWDSALAQKKTVKAECDELTVERNSLRAELETTLAHKNRLKAERDALAVERDEVRSMNAIYRKRVEAQYALIKRSVGWKMAWPLRLLRIDPPLHLPIMPRQQSDLPPS